MTADPPKIVKNFSTMKWSEAADNHLSLRTGLRMTSLNHVIYEKIETDLVLPPQVEGKSCSVKHSSVERFIIHLSSHDHPQHCEDDSKVRHVLEESTRGAARVISIKQFQKNKDGRTTFMPAILKCAGPDKWTVLQQACDDHLRTGRWKSINDCPSSGLVSKHRQSCVEITQ